MFWALIDPLYIIILAPRSGIVSLCDVSHKIDIFKIFTSWFAEWDDRCTGRLPTC